MAVSDANTNTLLDIARRKDPDGKIAKIIELMEQDNEILKDIPYRECNDGTNYRTTVRTGLPSAVWRMYNRGVPKSKSTTAQIVDHAAKLEARSEIDVDLVKLNTGNEREFRFTEDAAFLSAMNIQMAETVFYGDKNTPEAFVGFAPRYSKISTDKTKSGYNIIDAGGTGSGNTSIWLVGWGERTVHGIYPKGGKVGFSMTDKGIEKVEDAEGKPFYAYVTQFEWYNGLCLRDWRYVVRIANIDVSNLAAGGGSAADLNTLIIKALHRIPINKIGVRMGLYCNKDVFTALDLQTLNKNQAMVGYRQVQGEEVLSFRNVPIRQCDALKNDEAQVL